MIFTASFKALKPFMCLFFIHCFFVHRFAGRDFGSVRDGRFGGGSKSSFPGAGLVKPQWDLNRLPKFEKHFYKEHPVTASRSLVTC